MLPVLAFIRNSELPKTEPKRQIQLYGAPCGGIGCPGNRQMASGRQYCLVGGGEWEGKEAAAPGVGLGWDAAGIQGSASTGSMFT